VQVRNPELSVNFHTQAAHVWKACLQRERQSQAVLIPLETFKLTKLVTPVTSNPRRYRTHPPFTTVEQIFTTLTVLDGMHPVPVALAWYPIQQQQLPELSVGIPVPHEVPTLGEENAGQTVGVGVGVGVVTGTQPVAFALASNPKKQQQNALLISGFGLPVEQAELPF